ncbi:putative inner membrane peptidase, partial [Pasteurella multocida subsp. multocida str. Anand1_cattle]
VPLLGVAKPKDEILVRLESPGGMVHGYGLAASQLLRLKQHGIKLTVAVDKNSSQWGIYDGLRGGYYCCRAILRFWISRCGCTNS